MPTPENQVDARIQANVGQANVATAKDLEQSGASMPVEFIELGLALELLIDSHPNFTDAVKTAVLALDGEFLFDLPHGDDPAGKGRVAAVRLAYAGLDAPRVAFVFLSDDGSETRIEAAGEQAEHLKNFAESFVSVLEKIGRH